MYLNQASSLALSHFQQAALSYGQACYVEAIQHYLAGLKFEAAQHHYIYADLAKAYEMVGQWNKALACLDTALRLCPDSPTALRRKARILDEKTCYDTLISTDDFQKPPPQEFLEHLRLDPTTSPHQTINAKFFDLICHSAMKSQTVWNIYRLVHRTRTELGEMLGCYPIVRIPISVMNTNGIAASAHSLPKWASGRYDGSSICLVYCAVDEPVLGILYALLRHEWVHLLVHDLTQGRCPMWLNEGLAQRIARPMFQSERLVLERAVQQKRLLPFSTLSQPFRELPTKSRKLAYTQSAAIAEFLIQQFGFPKIRALLCELSNGTQTEAAVEQVFARTLAEVPLAGAF